MSDIIGRAVTYRTNDKYTGQVIGTSGTPGWVRVHWATPRNEIGIHKATDLIVTDSPPTQEELRKMYHG